MDNKEIDNMTLDIKDKVLGGVYKICEDPKETRGVFYIDDVKYKIPNPILDEYAKKYKPEELTDDGIPNIETQLRELREKDEEQLKTYEEDNKQRYKREMIQRVKCLSLNRMGKSILTNTFEMHPRDRTRLQEIMWTYNDIDHKDIINEFNELVSEEIFENDKLDYSKLPIYEFRC